MDSAGYDLGIFDQAVRAYAHLRAPIVPIKGPGANLLGDHFHPIIATLAPLYRLWPDARTLLIAQAFLIAVSVVPIAGLAMARLGRPTGIALSVAYGLSWGIQGAIAFDFHEICFAVPLLAFAVTRLAEERWRAAVAWALPLLLVKEDLGVAVAAFGLYLAFKRRYWLGLSVFVAGIAASAVTVSLLIPHFNRAGEYRYWGQVSNGGKQSLLQTIAGVPASLLQHPQKILLLLCLAAVTSFLALRSPISIIAAPVVGYRIVSTHPLQWSIGEVHYNAILMPVVFVAALDAVTLLRASRFPTARLYSRTAPVAAVVIGIAALPFFSFWRFTRPDFYTASPHVVAARRLLAQIPSGSSVAASNYLAAQLTDRCEVTLFADVHRRPTDWVVVDSRRLGGVPAPLAVQRARLAALPAEGLTLVKQADGVLLFRRLPAGGGSGPQSASPSALLGRQAAGRRPQAGQTGRTDDGAGTESGAAAGVRRPDAGSRRKTVTVSERWLAQKRRRPSGLRAMSRGQAPPHATTSTGSR
ncbi:DUF2079 domain-containing protein [Actinomadura logoneensis]|uniref:DUF2079 domain-containing protein n=1 Tax=Actinomadura logoneensis TaxID=2293572 RepID=A0A372JDJ3_9ACTN|nr:DUF2079 domain-containing protein [Actinomadura logoneensis]